MQPGKGRCRRWLCALLACLACGGTMGLRCGAQDTVYRSVPTDGCRIALTFDDGPHPGQTHRILEVLERYGVRATFFMIGVNIRNYPDAAREVIARGHEVGNHTDSHVCPRNLSESALAAELDRCEDTLENLCEYRPHLFRPPEGVVNAHVRHCAERGDYTVILWSVDTRDWETRQAGVIAGRVLSRIRPGDIVLMHDYVADSKTPEALELMLPKLLALGYEPVTVSELLGIG